MSRRTLDRVDRTRTRSADPNSTGQAEPAIARPNYIGRNGQLVQPYATPVEGSWFPGWPAPNLDYVSLSTACSHSQQGMIRLQLTNIGLRPTA